MTPKEKAQEIINKFRHYSNGYKWTTTVAGKSIVLVDTEMQVKNAKQCALIAVNEILKSNPCCESLDRGANFIWQDNTYYWQEVRKEIEAL